MVDKKPDIKEIMSDAKKAIPFFASVPAEAWVAMGQQTTLAVYAAALETEAYQDFLKSHKIDPKSIKSTEDFHQLPIIDKDNYVKRYGFQKINSKAVTGNLYSFSLSSGTIDEPTVWPRYFAQEEGYIGIFDTFMTLNWQIDRRKTLVINAFALGVYTSGIAVNIALRPLTQKYPLTLATTGADIDNISRTVKQLGSGYEQILLFSYPTFARTVLDKLEEAGINLKSLNMKLFIAGEGHSVEWRQYINKLITGNSYDLTTIIDGYGTTDLGLLGVGSALTNLIRDLASKDSNLREALFGKTKVVPTVFQYVPANFYIEQLGSEPIFTSKVATPLVRYNIHDRGGTISFRDMEGILSEYGYDYKKILAKAKLPAEIIWQQPFVYCFGRRDDTVIIGGGNIFPEQIAPVLFDAKANDVHSFKLGMEVDKDQHQMLVVLLESKNSCKHNKLQTGLLERKYHNLILKQLLKVNADYAASYRADPKYCDPIIRICEYGTGPFENDSQRTKPKLVIK